MKRQMKKLAGIVCMASMLVCMPCVSAGAVSVSVDGNAEEWENVAMQESDSSKVEKWAVAQDDSYLYFYIHQNGGNQWGMPIDGTQIKFQYADGTTGSKTMLQFTNLAKEIRDGSYGLVDGAETAYEPSTEKGKYEVEAAVPKTFLADDDFTLSYCGASVSSEKIPDCKDISLPDKEEAVYKGITIDGTFNDWNAVSKTDVDVDVLEKMAVVFDGDYLYIYFKETDDGALTWSGAFNNGKFTIYTDTGRNTSFKLNKDSIDGIEGAKVAHSNKQYEIAIPAEAIKQYKETISVGYYMSDKMLIEDIANLKEDSSSDKSFSGIVYDGKYADWDYYPHDLVQYSTPGSKGGDAEAALYADGDVLYGHVRSTLHVNEGEFQPFAIRINEKDKYTINFRLVTVDKDGNINKDPQLKDLEKGTYEYYLWDLNSGSTATNINDPDAPIYGQMMVTYGVSSDEMEYKVDLEKLAKHFDMEASDMKIIQAHYVNIGGEWVTFAGTSTGPVMGLSLCAIAVIGGLYFKKHKIKVVK